MALYCAFRRALSRFFVCFVLLFSFADVVTYVRTYNSRPTKLQFVSLLRCSYVILFVGKRQIPVNHPARNRHQTNAAGTARRARDGAGRSRARLPRRLACRRRGSRSCLGSRRTSPPLVRPSRRKVTVAAHVRVVHHWRVQQGRTEPTTEAHLPGRELLDCV